MRVAELREQVEAADGTRAGRRDARIGVGEKRQAGANPAGMRAVVERLDFGLVGGDEIIVVSGKVILDDERLLVRVRGSGSKVRRDQRHRNVEPRIDVVAAPSRARRVAGEQTAAQLVEAAVAGQRQQPGAAASGFGRPDRVTHVCKARAVAEAEIIQRRSRADFLQIAVRMMDHRRCGGIG